MSTKKAIYECEDCAASFDRPSRLANHLRTHTGERPFVCEYEDCGKSYSSSSHLKRHATTHENSHKCPVEGCSEVLKTQATLKKHLDNMHQKKKQKLYKCTECDKDFNKRNWLQSHMVKQHGGKCPYKCSLESCGKEFLVPSKLKRHMKTHNGYQCNIPGCEEVFLKWSLYVTHLKQFHPRVHKCHICKKEFSHSSNLKSHQGVHKQSRKVFPCDMPNCSRFYFAEKNLNWHVINYHEARPFVCEMESCHRAFKTKDALDFHKQRHIKRRRQKKKKSIPDFSAVLSGLADPRKFTRKMPPKRVLSESSEEFTTDEEVTYDQDTSREERSCKNSNSEGSEEDCNTDPHQQSNRKLLLKRARLESSSRYISVVEEEVCFYEETPQKTQTASEGLDGDKELTQTDNIVSNLSETSSLEPPSKCAKLKADENDSGSNERTNLLLKVRSPEKPAAAVSDLVTTRNNSECMLKHKMYVDDSASSSEYETITVSLLSGFSDRNCSESEEMSCLSDAGG